MEELPTELLEKIFLLLRRPDRLSAALVCKRWAEIVSASRLLRDVCLVFRVADLQRATPTLLGSHRHYANLKICGGKLHNFHPEFWARIAGDLVSLQLEKCDLLTEVFCSILEGCQRLQSLKIKACRNMMMSQGIFKPPDHICVAKVQQSLRNVRHLSLQQNRELSDASVDQMLTLMPNITSLYLAGWSTIIGSSFDDLTFQNVLVCMMRSKQEFVDLDFSDTCINDKALIQIVELYRGSLNSLRLDDCYELTAEVYEAIGECSKLRLLSLHETWRTNDDNLECILTKTPDLEYLDLAYCRRISSQSLRLIVQLKKLRHLSLHSCNGIDSWSSLGALKELRHLSLHSCNGIDSWSSLGALKELRHLDLSETQCDVEALQQLASLKNLRTLDLGHCVKLDSECFEIICDSFRKLEKLNLDFSNTLTDEAGCKFHQLKHLRSLEIFAAAGISDRSFENGIGASDMTFLRVRLCPLLTDDALLSIAKHHVCLEYLDLSSCVRITDVGLISVVQRLSRLRTLILRGCRSLTDRSLHALQDNCPHLRKLDVVDCAMSGDAIDRLAHLRPSLSFSRRLEYFFEC